MFFRPPSPMPLNFNRGDLHLRLTHLQWPCTIVSNSVLFNSPTPYSLHLVVRWMGKVLTSTVWQSSHLASRWHGVSCSMQVFKSPRYTTSVLETITSLRLTLNYIIAWRDWILSREQNRFMWQVTDNTPTSMPKLDVSFLAVFNVRPVLGEIPIFIRPLSLLWSKKHDGLRLIRQGRFDRRAFVRIIRCADDRMRVVSNDCWTKICFACFMLA